MKKTKIIALIIVAGVFIGLLVYIRHNYLISYIKSESMEPTYYRGDIVIVRRGDPREIKVGDVIVFREPNGNDLILHRVVYIEERDGKLYFLTKGDNPVTNPYIDSWGGQYWVPEDLVVGKLVGRVPYLGLFFLYLDEPGARLMFIMIVVLLFALYMNATGEERPSVAPLTAYLKGARLKIVVVVILMLFMVVVVSISFIGRGEANVDVIRPVSVYKSGDKSYIVVRLRIISRISRVEAIKYIAVNASVDTAVYGYGCWEIKYPFYGEKNVSIAIVLNATISVEDLSTKLVLYFQVLIKNYLSGKTRVMNLKSKALRMTI